MSHLHILRWRVRPAAFVALTLCGAAMAAIGLARSQGGPPTVPTQSVPFIPPSGGGATADSNQRMIAVTGVDVSGASVLYLVDTVNMRLAVYQASSSGSNSGVRLVAARRIELDMELNGFHDNSEFTYKELRQKFVEQGLIDADPVTPSTGAKTSGAKTGVDAGDPERPTGQ